MLVEQCPMGGSLWEGENYPEYSNLTPSKCGSGVELWPEGRNIGHE